MMNKSEHLDTLKGIIKEAKIAMLTNISSEGHLVAHPMANQEIEFDGDLWFFSEEGEKVKEIEANPEVNVSYSDNSYASIRGKACIVRDLAKKKELWKPDVEAWFQKKVEDPSIVLIKVQAEAAEYWKSPGAVMTAIEFIGAAISGEQPEPGENKAFDIK